MQRRLKGIGKTRAYIRLYNKPVHHGFYAVLFIFLQLRLLLGEIVHRAVRPHSGITLTHKLGKKLAVFPLAFPYDGRHYLYAAALRQLHYPIHHLIRAYSRRR